MNTRVLSLLLFTLVSLAAMLFWFIQRAPVPKPPSVAKPPLPVMAPPKENASIAEAVEPRHYRPPPVSAAVRRKVDDFIRRYKDVPPAELRKNEEVREMMAGFMEGLNTPEFQRKFDERIAAIKSAKGVEHGTLQIESENLTDPEGRAWLEALFSEDPQRMEDYIFNKIDGAIFELAFDPTMEKTESGVTVKPAAAPAPAENKQPD